MDNRERFAWTILLIAAAVFVALLVGIPLSVYQWIQHATVPPSLSLQTLSGTTQVEHPGEAPRLVFLEDGPFAVAPGAVIRNDADSEAILAIGSPDGQYALGTVQIYPNTQIEITTAKSPRYRQSDDKHWLDVHIVVGRIRLGLARETGHVTDFRGWTPHARFVLWEAGSYSFDVTNQQSQLTVKEGKATIVSAVDQLRLVEGQRGVIGADGIPDGPLPPARDLIANGHFSQPLENSWIIEVNAADHDQPAGNVDVVTSAGREAVHLSRDGVGHAETGIYQLINESTSGYQSLQLHLSGRIDSQSLTVCGSVGSECPLMVRLDYRDASGGTRSWVQGFYYWQDPAAPDSPTLCETCPPPRQEHEQTGQGTSFFYDSPNLLEILAQDGAPPSRIDQIAVYASGHSYDVQVSEVELLVEE